MNINYIDILNIPNGIQVIWSGFNEIQKCFSKKNSLQFELLGNAGIYSINYERITLNKERFKTGAQIGFSFFGNNSWKGIMQPIGITEIYSMGNNHLELGFAGAPNYVWRTDNTKEWDYLVFGRFGYRYQKPNKKFIFRAAYMPILPPQLGHWGGIAFGYAF